MKQDAKLSRLLFFILTAALVQAFPVIPFHSDAQAETLQPNIILINVDNMGWGDLCYLNSSGNGCNYDCVSKPTGTCTKEECNTLTYRTERPENCVDKSTKTPNLDILASGGVTLTNFYTPVPICTPSRAALMTGLDPRRFGIVATPTPGMGENELPGSAWTLAEELSNLSKENNGLQDYNTAIIGKWQLGGKEDNVSWKQGFEYNYVMPVGIHYGHTGFCLGEKLETKPTHTNLETTSVYWQHVDDTLPHGSDQTTTEKTLFNCSTSPDESISSHNTRTAWTNFSSAGHEGRSLTGILTQKAIQYINGYIAPDNNPSSSFEARNKTSQPFFMYLAYPAPHATLRVHLPVTRAGEVRETCQSKTSGHCAGDKLTQECTHQCELDHFYDDVIQEIDIQFGELLATLQTTTDLRPAAEGQKLEQTTIVIFTSDNGPFLGQVAEYFPFRINRTAGMKGGQKQNFEGGVKVPFIASWPNGNWTSGVHSSPPADMMDIYATLVTVAKNVSQSVDECNNQVTVVNRDNFDAAVMVDGKNIRNVLEGGGCASKQRKDIHTNWLFTTDTCVSWTDRPNYTFIDTVETLVNSQAQSWETVDWNWWDFDNYCKEYGKQYPFAIRSYDPENNPDFFKYKLYLDDNFDVQEDFTTGLYDVVSRPTESFVTFSGTEVDTLKDRVKQYQAGFSFKYYFPYIKDGQNGDTSKWQNDLSLQSGENVLMNAVIELYDLTGKPVGTYSLSGESAIKGGARVTIDPFALVEDMATRATGSFEGSLIVKTTAPAAVMTNSIMPSAASGFSMNYSTEPRQVSYFTKNNDNTSGYQVDLLMQNISDAPGSVTVKLKARDGSLVSGATKTFEVQPFETKKIRPSEIAAGGDVRGTIEVCSNLTSTIEGQGPAIPVMIRTQAGSDSVALYGSGVSRTQHYFPRLKHGAVDGVNWESWISLFNAGSSVSNATVRFYDNYGNVLNSADSPVPVEPGKKVTLSQASSKSTQVSAVIEADEPIVAQTNMISSTSYDTFDTAMPGGLLLFPKVYVSSTYVNMLYIQNPDGTEKSVTIKLHSTDGNTEQILGEKIPIPGNGTLPFQLPSGARGYVTVSANNTGLIAGALQYLINGATAVATYNGTPY